MKCMKKRIFSFVLASIFCLSLLTGCQLGIRTAAPEEEGPVTVYAVDMSLKENVEKLHEQRDYDLSEFAFITKYNNSVDSGRKVDVQLFTDAETMNRQISTEVLSGGGPDLFLFRDSTLPYFQKYASQGVFADLDEYLQGSGYEESQFQQTVFDYGKVNGKQKFVPLEYGIPVCITLQSLAEEYGLDEIGKQLNYQNYYELLSKTNTMGISISEEYDFNLFWFSELDSFRYRMVPAFINEERKEGQFTSPLFQEAIEDYKEVVENQRGRDAFLTAFGTARERALAEKKLLFYNDPIMSDMQLMNVFIDKYFVYGEQEGYKELMNDKPLIYPIKEYNGEDYSAYVGRMMAINDNSNRKNKAWEVIDYALSPSFQNSMVDADYSAGLNPVSLEGQQRNKEMLLNINSEQRAVMKDFIDRYYELLNSVTKCDCLMYNSMYVQEVFDPLYVEYENGKKTLDEFVKELQNKTGLYLKEQN